jgi:hypothetical protein
VNKEIITWERALQISNNCSEEFLDHGETNFATKAELCAAILWLNDNCAKNLQKKDNALDEIATIAFKARRYINEKI